MMRRDGQSTAHPSVENAAHSSVQPVLTAPTARTLKVNDEHVRPTEKCILTRVTPSRLPSSYVPFTSPSRLPSSYVPLTC